MDNFISVSQAAAKLGVSRSRVIALCKQGRIEGVQKLGNALAIPENFIVSDGTRGPGFQKISQDTDKSDK